MKTVDIPHKLVALNEYINSERTNRYVAAKIKKDMTNICMLHFIGMKFKTPLKLGFIWRRKNKRMDVDNIAFSKKFILDGMVAAKCIPDDSQKHIVGFGKEEFVVDKNEGVTVLIVELP